MIWLLAPHSLRKVRLCCRWLVSHHSMKGSNLIVVHRRVKITASLLNFRSLRGAQYLSDCSTALWKFPYTTQSNRSSFFFFFFFAVLSFIYGILHLLHSALPLPTIDAFLPLHFLCHHDSAICYFYTVQIRWKLLFCSFGVLSVSSVCWCRLYLWNQSGLCRKGSQKQEQETENTGMKWRSLCVIDVRYQWSDSLLRKLEQALRPGHLPLPFILSPSLT